MVWRDIAAGIDVCEGTLAVPPHGAPRGSWPAAAAPHSRMCTAQPSLPIAGCAASRQASAAGQGAPVGARAGVGGQGIGP